MGIATSGFYKASNNFDACLENYDKNLVRASKCDPLNPKAIWKYDVNNQTICNYATKNCLQSGGKLSDHGKVVAVTDDHSDSMKWTYDGTKGGTVCNKLSSPICLQYSGPPNSKTYEVKAANDDNKVDKKWTIKPAVCYTSQQFPTVKLDAKMQNTVCEKVCTDQNGTYQAGQWGNKGAAGWCRCNVGGACHESA